MVLDFFFHLTIVKNALEFFFHFFHMTVVRNALSLPKHSLYLKLWVGRRVNRNDTVVYHWYNLTVILPPLYDHSDIALDL